MNQKKAYARHLGQQPPRERVQRVRESARLTESSELFASIPGYPYMDGRDLYSETGPYGFMDGGPTFALSRRDNRLTGEILPAAITWWQLKIIRDRARQIARGNEYCLAAINACRSYVVGTGFKYRAIPRKKADVPKDLLERAQDILDLWSEHNNMGEIEAEIVYRLHAEGEAFLRTFRGEDGLLRVRFVEPELVRPPSDDATPKDSFGIQVADEDIHERVGYWVVERPWIDPTPTLVPADEILHLRNNVESNAKRGLPTIWAVESNLRAAEDILQSMVSLAKARAKVAIVRKVADTPPEAIEALTATATDYTVTDPTTQQTTNISRLGYGSILTTSDNVSYEFPGANLGSGDLVEVLRANLRAIAARFGLSEAMLSADPSSANYASALVAEAPATKQLEHFQHQLSGALGTRRTRPNRSLAWQQLGLAVDVGLLPREVLRMLDIQCDVPTVASRDKAAEASQHQTYVQMGVMSKSQVRAAIGLDDGTTREQIERERAQDAADAQKYGPPGGEAQPPGPGGPDPQEGPRANPSSGPPTPPQPDRP